MFTVLHFNYTRPIKVSTWYFVHFPLLFFNAFNLRGILSIKFLIICSSILYHSCCVLPHNPRTLQGGLLYFASLLFKMDHEFSIGFISELCAGHFITEKFWFSSQALTIFAVYLGSSSCWNTTSLHSLHFVHYIQ